MRLASATRLVSLGALLATVLAAHAAAAQEKEKQQFDLRHRFDLGRVWLFPVPPHVEPPDRIIFSHRHHAKMGEDCTDCHTTAEEATRAGTIGLLKEADCFECHDIDDREDCGTCHTNAENPSATFTRRPTELKFNHEAHLELDDVECTTCHADARTSESPDDRLVPSMSTCTGCHQRDLDQLACRKCHTSLRDLGMAPMDEAVHKPGFFGMHGVWATGNSALCTECHEQTFCSDCHGGGTQPMRPSVHSPELIERLFIHRGDFLGRHAIEAAARPQSCYSCHSTTYCRDCHDTTRLRERGGTSATFSPHPAGYVSRGGQAFHGTDARMAPQHCATCHDQGAASNCVDCHRVGGVGGNPHPPGWSRRGQEEQMSSSRACLPCHTMGF